MKTLIVYSSKTGNTRTLAEALKTAAGNGADIYPVGEAPAPDGYDRIAVGFWLQGGKPDPASAAYLASVGRARLFLFATHGAAADSGHAANAMAQAKALAPDATMVGAFNCPGEVNAELLEKIKKKDPPPPWIDDAPAAVGHPDALDIARLKDAWAAATSAVPTDG